MPTGRPLSRRRLLAALPLGLAACGYRPLRSVVAGSPKLGVDRADALVPGGFGVRLADEAAFGAREELARYGALGGGEALDRVGVVIARVDERSEGVAVDEASGRPIARGVRVRVVARGEVRGEHGEWETRDVEASEVVATAPSSPSWSGARDAAIREVARSAGAKVARVVLGLPE